MGARKSASSKRHQVGFRRRRAAKWAKSLDMKLVRIDGVDRLFISVINEEQGVQILLVEADGRARTRIHWEDREKIHVLPDEELGTEILTQTDIGRRFMALQSGARGELHRQMAVYHGLPRYHTLQEAMASNV